MNCFSRERVKGFLKTQGTIFVNEDGEEIILRGWGAGNWTNPEGFMIGCGLPDIFNQMNEAGMGEDIFAVINGHVKYTQPANFENARTLDKVIREMCGETYAKTFWQKWYRNYLMEDDFIYMDKLGYNHIRLAICHWAFLKEEPGYHFNEDSFRMLDNIINWCEKYHIYAILDMHAAVGGQSGTWCDDGVDNVPHLFIDEESAERTIVLWEKIVERYKDRWGIGGYEILNEPLTSGNYDYLIPKLSEFYDECIRRIRIIDKKHIIFLEGNRAGTAFHVFSKAFDEEVNNWCITVHRYHNSPEPRTLKETLRYRDKFNVPVWMGEGSSGDRWNAAWYELLAENHVSFNLWNWKASDEPFQLRAPLRNPVPADWKIIVSYGKHGTAKPGYEHAQRIFDEMLECIKYENCIKDEKTNIQLNHRPGAVIPAVAYNEIPGCGKSFRGHYDYDIIHNIRYGDKMEIFYLPDKEKEKAPQNTPEGCAIDEAEDIWQDTVLRLSNGDFASYTVREVLQSCEISLNCIVESESEILLRNRLDVIISQVKAYAKDNSFVKIPLGKVETADSEIIKIEVKSGSIVVRDILFGTEQLE